MVRPLHRKLSCFVLCSAALVSLSACGMKWPEWAIIDSDPLAFLSAEDKSLAPPPPHMSSPGMVGAQKNSENQTPVQPITIEQSKPLALEAGGPLGSFGFNLDTYLGQEVLDMSERIERLEKAVQAMHRDLGIIAPAVQELSDNTEPAMALTSNKVMQGSVDASGQPVSLQALSAHTNNTPLNAPSLKVAPVSDSEKPVYQGAQSLIAKPGSTTVTGVRVGHHADKVRIVFDVTSKTNFYVDLDNAENILVVELPDANWDVPVTRESFGTLPLVKSYKVDRLGGGAGHIFVLQLKKSTRVLMQTKLPALSGGGQRLVIDLAR